MRDRQGRTAGSVRAAARTRPRSGRREGLRAAPDPARRRARSPVAGPGPRTPRRSPGRSAGPRSGASPSRRMPGAGPGRGATRGSPPAPAPPRPSRGRCGGSRVGRRRPGSSRAAGSCATWASPENMPLKPRAAAQPPGPALPVDRPQHPREDPLEGRVAHPVPEPGPDAAAMGPREVDGRDAGVEVDRQGGRHADERQAQVFGHGPARRSRSGRR